MPYVSRFGTQRGLAGIGHPRFRKVPKLPRRGDEKGHVRTKIQYSPLPIFRLL
jgi:hypothetical protein